LNKPSSERVKKYALGGFEIMLTLRPSLERGQGDHGWLKSRHSFSFADYHDVKHMGFRSLRVINEDHVAAGMGFGTHPHNDMEIITYMVSGELAHKDSMGNGSSIKAGDVQVMTAGRGIEHSEFNPSETNPAHLLQIWIRPSVRGLPPAYGEKTFRVRDEPGRLHALVSGAKGDAPLKIQQDAQLFAALLNKGQSLNYALKQDRHAWLQVVKGSLKVNGLAASSGDGLAISEEKNVEILAETEAEFLLFDLA
jgi:quercetin 2,3-dioxygenase